MLEPKKAPEPKPLPKDEPEDPEPEEPEEPKPKKKKHKHAVNLVFNMGNGEAPIVVDATDPDGTPIVLPSFSSATPAPSPTTAPTPAAAPVEIIKL